MSVLQSFRTVRWFRTFNLVLQAGLCVSLFGGLNSIALNHAWRYDLTRQRRYSLSPETLAWLHNLNAPVHVVVTTNEDSDNPDVRGLLREYEYATRDNYDPATGRDGRVTVDYLDVYQRRHDAEQLGIEQANVIVFLCGDKRHALSLDELYRVEKGQRTEFQGEKAFTSALLDVSNPVRKKIYFLTGHSELNPEDTDPSRGLSALSDELRIRNFDVEALDFTLVRSVPDDAALVIAAAPKGVEPQVQEQLRQYLQARAGRLILLLRPGQASGLNDLLFDDWGIIADDDQIEDTDPQFLTDQRDNIIKAYSPHPITQTLIDNQVPLFIGPARSISQRLYPNRAASNGLTVTTLAATSPSAWGEVNYRSGGLPKYDPDFDLKGSTAMKGRLGVVVASERVQPRGNLPFSVQGGRVVVFGTADIVSYNRLVNPGNESIILNAVNWAVDRDVQLNVPARPIERFQLSLSAQELASLRYSLLFIVPGATALLGLLVYWTRRT